MIANFEIVSVTGKPGKLPGTSAYLMEQYDWLQLTLGRFLAPSRCDPKKSGADYLVVGEELEGEELEEAIDAELAAFEEVLERLSAELDGLVDAKVSEEGILTSLSALLELRLPRPREGAHSAFVWGGVLQIVGWGMDGSSGAADIPLKRLLGADSSERETYLGDLRAQLELSAGLASGARARNGRDSNAPLELASAVPPQPEKPEPAPVAEPRHTEEAYYDSLHRQFNMVKRPEPDERGFFGYLWLSIKYTAVALVVAGIGFTVAWFKLKDSNATQAVAAELPTYWPVSHERHWAIRVPVRDGDAAWSPFLLQEIEVGDSMAEGRDYFLAVTSPEHTGAEALEYFDQLQHGLTPRGMDITEHLEAGLQAWRWPGQPETRGE